MSSMQEITKALDNIENHINVTTREMRDEILQLKQRGSMQPMDYQNAPRGTLGDSVAKKFREVSEQFAATKSVRFTVPFEVKATIGAFTGSTSILASHGTIGSGMITQSPAALMLVGNLPTRPTGGVLTAHYGRYVGQTGAAGVQASEGGAKPEATPTFSDISQNAVTVAAYTTISEQSLKGDGELAAVVNNFLMGEVFEAADAMLIGGTAAAAWPFAGYDALSTAYPSAVYTGLGDAVADCVQNMRQSGFMPDIVVMNAMAYLDIVLSKNTSGDYLIPGAVTNAPGDIRLHGCKVVFSSLMTTGEALVLDSRYCEMGVSSEMTVELGYDADNFTRNLRTVRAEIGLIPTLRHVGAVRLVTPLP
ncbi:MAG: phage major capsid protein [Pseudomonadota bacterium]